MYGNRVLSFSKKQGTNKKKKKKKKDAWLYIIMRF